MSTQEILLITAIFSGFLILRFGLPLALMVLIRLFCKRVLHA